MLGTVFNIFFNSFFFISVDSCDQKGRPLFTSFLNCFSAKGFKVHLMNYDFLLSPPQQIDKFQNFSDDPLGYDSDSVASEKSLPLWIEQCTDQNVQYLIAIDSLSPLLLKLPVADIFSVIRRVNQTSTALISYHIYAHIIS